MAETMFVYSNFFRSLCNKEVNLTADNFKMMLVGAGYSPDQATHQYKSSVSSEITGTGYTAGGLLLPSKLTLTLAGGRWSIKGPNLSWPNATFSARYGIVYDDTPATDATKPLLVCADFGEVKSPSAGAFSVTWNTDGIAYADILAAA